MKRYLIFAALGPFIGGFFLLIATTVMSGYLDRPSASELAKLFVVFLKTLQYSYLFGILPVLMIAAVDDIFFHVKRINPVVRMLGRRRDRVFRGGVALRLAGSGHRRHPVHPVRPGRLRAGDDLVVAGA